MNYNKLKPIMDKKGQVLNGITGLVIGIMVLIFTVFAVLFGISKLNPSSFFTTGGADANATRDLQQNLTSGVSQFGQYIPTVLVIMGVVLAISGVALLIAYVRRMQGGGASL